MRISSSSSLLSFLLTGMLGASLALPLPIWSVECGDELVSAGTVILDADLSCAPADPDGSGYEGGLVVIGATILDFNGHTISCAGGLKRAIRMGGALLRNGTIANCEEGLKVGSGATVEHVVFTHNTWGVRVEGGRGNTFRNNTAVKNGTGFLLTLGEDDSGSEDNVLINNTATHNERAGFGVGKGRRNSLIGNTASFNGVGFRLNSAEISVRGNVAEENYGPGFEVLGGYGELEGNSAARNGGEGFIISGDRSLSIEGNLALQNGKDGFLLPAAFRVYPRELQRNVALNNGGHGLHVAGDDNPKSRIIDNTAVGHVTPHFDLSDDNPECRNTIWRRNTFETASQACLH